MDRNVEFLEVFRAHRSIRHYLDQSLLPNDLEAILEVGRRAPTDASGHMYSIVRITDRALRHQMVHLCGDQEHIERVAEFFIFCLDVYRLKRLVEHRGAEFGMQPVVSLLYGTVDTTLVAANMAIAAEALGYGICFIGGVQDNPDTIARELKLPKGVMPLFGLCIGVPDPQFEPSSVRPRLPRALTVKENRAIDAEFRAVAPRPAR